MADNNIQQTASANNPLEELSFDHIIGGPLRACAEAQREAALASYEYLKEMGLEADKTGLAKYQPATISFLFTKDGFTHRIRVPLLTIIPVPYLQINRINLTFQATVTECTNNELKAKFAASTSQVKQEQNLSHSDNITAKDNIDISICASASEVPPGMAKLMEILQTQMSEINDVK